MNSHAPFRTDLHLRADELVAWCGTLTLVGLLRFEVPLDWVAPAWAALAMALAAFAWMWGQRVFLHQALFLTFIVLFRAGTHNFYERSYFLAPAGYSRALTVSVTVAFLFAALWFAYRLRGVKPSHKEEGYIRFYLQTLGAHPEQVFFFCGLVLLTALIAAEYDRGDITIAWGLEAITIFLFALWVREHSFRLSGLALLLLCVAKIVTVDVWELGMRDRAITFLALGGLLILVSFLYTKKRDLIRRILAEP